MGARRSRGGTLERGAALPQRDRVATATLTVSLAGGAVPEVKATAPARRARPPTRVKVTPFAALAPLRAEDAGVPRRRDRLSFVTTFARSAGGARDALHTPQPRPVTAPLPDDVLFAGARARTAPATSSTLD